MLLKNPSSQTLFGITEDHQELDLSLDGYLVKNPNSTYFLRLGNDEMSPEFKKNDILIVDRSLSVRSGELGAFYYKNEPIFRRLLKVQNKFFLISSKNKLMIDPDELIIFGKLIGIARKI